STLLSLAAAYGELYFGAVFRDRLSLELQRDLFEHVPHLPSPLFKSHNSGYVMARITSDSDAAVSFPARLTGLGRNMVWLGAAFFLVPALHPIIGLVVVLVIPLYVAILVGFKRRIKDQFSVVQERTALASRELHESLVGVYETKAYGAEADRARRFVRRLAEKARSLVRGRCLMALAGHSTQVVVLIVSLFILIYGGAEVMRGRLSLGELVALNALVGYLLVPVNSLVNQGFEMQKSLAAVERLNEILEQPGEFGKRGGRIRARRARGHLRFSGVHFHYHVGEPVLREVDFEVQPGETVLFLGPSGVGKTSLMALLPRFYDASAGQIYLDGRPIGELDLRWLRNQIAFVSQDTFLFSDSVFNNIRIGSPTATREQVRSA
ncbi:MAG: ABC transporter ATP-binding protein, partial [bacterium]|nr:ABC transporter ATP-binding protein [bacterium]